MDNREIYRKAYFINWQEYPLRCLTMTEYNSKINYLKSINAIKIDLKRVCKTVRRPWIEHDAYSVMDRGNVISLFTKVNDVYERWYCWKDNNKNERAKPIGREAYNRISNLLREEQGASLCTAFGTVDKWYKSLVPAPLIYSNEWLEHQTLYHVYKADKSGAYPYECTKPLPDAHTAIEVCGFCEPNEEYPFAFYKKSGNHAIYNEYSTVQWDNYSIYRSSKTKLTTFDLLPPDENETTVLMKASDYSLKDIMEDLYSKRKDDPDIKQSMVSFIGFMQSVNFNNNFAGHVAVVVLGRHVNDMLKKIKVIESEGGMILQIQTDSIMWRGKKSSCTVDTKSLGAFVSEQEDTEAYIKNIGQYAISDGVRILSVKHQGLGNVALPPLKKVSDIEKMQMKYLYYDYEEDLFKEKIYG